MSAASPGRAGFPTACLAITLAAVLWITATASSAMATMLPPPWRLAILFDREVWEPPAVVNDRVVPLRSGMGPLTFGDDAHGRP